MEQNVNTTSETSPLYGNAFLQLANLDEGVYEVGDREDMIQLADDIKPAEIEADIEVADDDDSGIVGIVKSITDIDDEDEEEETIKVYDGDAEDESELKDSYVGYIILSCNACHTPIFKEKEEVVIDKDGEVNATESCPYCSSTEGYTIKGMVADYEEEPEATAETEDGEEVEVEVKREFQTESSNKPIHISAKGNAHTCKDGECMHELFGRGKKEITLTHGDELKLAVKQGDFGGTMAALKSGYKDLLDNKLIKRDTYEREINEIEDALDVVKREQKRGNEVSADDLKETIKRLYDTFADYCKTQGVKLEAARRPLRKSRFSEDIEKATIETDGITYSIEQRENNRSTDEDEEMIVPLDRETEEEFEDEYEYAKEESDEDEEEVEVGEEVTEVEEESFNRLGTRYLCRVYENVSNFKTTDIYCGKNNTLCVEGVITFKRGNKKNTKFVFEAYRTGRNNIRLVGMNESLASGKRAFVVEGKLRRGTLFTESLSYNYRQGNQRVRGTINESVQRIGRR